jgi:transcriptional regulator NrdR family protein
MSKRPTEDDGLRCPRCACPDSSVTKTRKLPTNMVRRYRTCRNCGWTWRTLEAREPMAGPHMDNRT